MGTTSKDRIVVAVPDRPWIVSYWDRDAIAGVYVAMTDALRECGVAIVDVELQRLEAGVYRTVSIWDGDRRRAVRSAIEGGDPT